MEQMNISRIDDQLYEIDEEQTKKEAMRILKRYRTLKLGLRGYELKVTPVYSIEPKTFGNEFKSTVEDNVIRKLDYLLYIEDTVNQMDNEDERRVIVEGYLSKEKHSWVKMSAKLFMSKTDYYRLRHRALIKFARLLNKEVYRII